MYGAGCSRFENHEFQSIVRLLSRSCVTGKVVLNPSMTKYQPSVWRRLRNFLPVKGFQFDRPLVLFQSDDWGRVGVRDQEGFEQLRAEGIALGEHPYDFYSLETAEDLDALAAVLRQHRDSSGRNPCIGMNFIVTNPDFPKMNAHPQGPLQLLPLAGGLPPGWKRPNLLEGYRGGIEQGVFHAALHGTTHFCRSAVERNLTNGIERAKFVQTLWGAGTPYIYWRMPWIGYEYWDPEASKNEEFVSAEAQRELIGQAVGEFAKLFTKLPQSACAPGYRANDETHRAWAQHGIRTAQNGPGPLAPPYFDRDELLNLTRTVDFEPAVDPGFSVETCLQQAARCFEDGLPAIVSMHSINFHSTLRDFRSRAVQALDEFLSVLERKYDELLYLHDEDLYDLVSKGSYKWSDRAVRVNVVRKSFIKAAVKWRPEE